MASHQDGAAGLGGSRLVARQIWRESGIRGFYRGFGTVIVGTIPARTIYMTSLEVTKSATTKLGEGLHLSPTATAGLASAAGGAAASLSTQAVVVPVDVVSQRLMMHGVELGGSSSSSSSSSSGSSSSGSAAAASQPGHRASVPAAADTRTSPTASSTRGYSSSIPRQWSSDTSSVIKGPTVSSSSSSSVGSSVGSGHAARHRALPAGACFRSSRCSFSTHAAAPRMSGLQMTKLILQQEGVAGLYRGFWPSVGTFVPNSAIWWGAYGFYQRLLGEHLPAQHPVAVETAAAVLSGCTSALLTNPLDLVKTRLQVAEPDASGAVPTFRQLLRELLAEEGPRGLLRGLAPRMAASVCWGTAMVSVYNLLKRISAADVPVQ